MISGGYEDRLSIDRDVTSTDGSGGERERVVDSTISDSVHVGTIFTLGKEKLLHGLFYLMDKSQVGKG